MTVSQSVSLYIVLFFSNELNEGENYHLLNRSWLRKEGAFLVYPENFFFKIYRPCFSTSTYFFLLYSSWAIKLFLWGEARQLTTVTMRGQLMGTDCKWSSRALQEVGLAKPKYHSWLRRLHVVNKGDCSAKRKPTWKKGTGILQWESWNRFAVIPGLWSKRIWGGKEVGH